MLDGKRHGNAHIFKLVEDELKKRGFTKSAEQIRVKWKHLKSVYYQVKRQNLVSGASRNESPHWDLLEELLSERPVAVASTSFGVESQELTGKYFESVIRSGSINYCIIT
jgi:hypothetical protein